MEEKRIQQEIELQTYLNRLIRNDMEDRLEQLKTDENLSEKEKQEAIGDVEQRIVSINQTLESLFI